LVWTGFIWLWTGPLATCCEHESGPSGSMNDGEFDHLSDHNLLRLSNVEKMCEATKITF